MNERWDVIVSNRGGAFGVSVATETEAQALADVFGNSRTEVEIIPIQIETYAQAAEGIALWLKGKVK